MLGGDARTSAQLLDTGHAVSPVLFAGRGTETVHVNKQKPSSGRPFIEISAADVYTVGAHPVVHLDTGAALSLLGGIGFRSVYVDVSVREGADTAVWRPAPDATAADSWTWNAVVPGHAAPAGDITIVPSPPPHASSRDFGQAGWIAGSFVVVAATGFLIATLASRRRRKRPPRAFNPPPGWPPPPRGWIPPAGWQPDRAGHRRPLAGASSTDCRFAYAGSGPRYRNTVSAARASPARRTCGE